MTPSHALKHANEERWQAVARHAFCAELSAGTLPASTMAAYLIQDYTFIDGFTRLAATAIAHAPTLKDAVPLAQFLAVITGPENTYFLRSFDALGVTEGEWKEPVLWSATQELQDTMREARTTGSYACMMAVLLVAEWSYLSWATPCNPPATSLPFYFSEWITLHAGPDFEGVVAYLQAQLDASWESLPDEERRLAESLFTKMVSLEQAFFDKAYASR